jgi:hypothetical protein
VSLTTNNLELFEAWYKDEGSKAVWNPLDSTLVLPGSTPYNNNHGLPVQNYPDRATGVRATAMTLLDPRHARILASLRASNSPYYTAIEIGYDGSWGSSPLVICQVLHDMGVGKT